MLQKYDDSNPANKIELTSRFVWSHPAHMIATFFGAGLPSKAPGTYGSLAGALSFIVLSPAMTTAAWVILSIALFIAGAWAAGKVAADLGVEDHKGVVVDEVVDIIDEKMKNGAGVMLDDVVAAFYAWVVVSILGWLFG